MLLEFGKRDYNHIQKLATRWQLGSQDTITRIMKEHREMDKLRQEKKRENWKRQLEE